MTQTELEQLSRDVAKKRGCEPYRIVHEIINGVHYKNALYLAQDSAFCFELAIDEYFEITVNVGEVYATDKSFNHIRHERYSNHKNDKNQATRVAILRAYLAKGE